jgi:hypothetical protein
VVNSAGTIPLAKPLGLNNLATRPTNWPVIIKPVEQWL